MNQIQRAIMICVLLGLLITAPLSHKDPAAATPQADYVAITLNGAVIVGSAPTAADFNGDGYKEIVVGGKDGILHVLSFNGSVWSEVWSHQTNIDINAANPPNPSTDNNIRTSQAIADLDKCAKMALEQGKSALYVLAQTRLGMLLQSGPASGFGAPGE